MQKTIGSMNGPWALAFKAALVLIPFLVAGAARTYYLAETRLDDLDKRLVKREANAFTSQNGLEVWKSVADRPTRAELKATSDAITTTVNQNMEHILRQLNELHKDVRELRKQGRQE